MVVVRAPPLALALVVRVVPPLLVGVAVVVVLVVLAPPLGQVVLAPTSALVVRVPPLAVCVVPQSSRLFERLLRRWRWRGGFGRSNLREGCLRSVHAICDVGQTDGPEPPDEESFAQSTLSLGAAHQPA